LNARTTKGGILSSTLKIDVLCDYLANKSPTSWMVTKKKKVRGYAPSSIFL
jgi:hypothetical protein